MKKLLMSTTIILLTICTMVPFSVRIAKAASNIVYATGGNITEGEYNVYTSQAASGSYLQFYAFDKYYSFDQYHSACIIKIDLDNIYSGDITLNFSNNYNTLFGLWWTETEQGSCGIDGLNKQFILHLNEVQSLTVYLCSAQTSSNGIQPTSVSSNLAVSSLYSDLLTYDIPLERVSAYSYFLGVGDKIHYDSSAPLPYIVMDTTKSSQAWVYGGKTYLIAYAFERSMGNLTFENMFNISYSGVYSTNYMNASVAPTIASGFLFTWVEITFNTGYNGWFTITPNVSGKVVPLYFNLTDNTISTELAEFIHHDPNNVTYNQLQQIIDALVNAGSGDDTSEDISDASDDLTNINNQINVITDQIDIDFNNNINNIDLDDHDFFSGLTNTTNYFKVYVQDFYNNIGDIKALLIVPVIVTIMMLIAGWMF